MINQAVRTDTKAPQWEQKADVSFIGKSSVLEGLTGLPFPRDSGLCTKFATQIIFRRSSSKYISVSIVPAKNASVKHIAKVRSWGKKLNELDVKSFGEIFHEVSSTYTLRFRLS